MSLSSDSAVLTMPVQPANTNGGNGFGWGDGGLLWIIILFLFAFCGGWGGNWGGNGNTGAGVVDGYVLTSDFANIERKMDGINNGMCDGFYRQAQLVNGVYAAAVCHADAAAGVLLREPLCHSGRQLQSGHPVLRDPEHGAEHHPGHHRQPEPERPRHP